MAPTRQAVTPADNLIGRGNPFFFRHSRHKVDALNGTTPKVMRVFCLTRAQSGNWSKSICFTVIPHGFCCNAATLVKVDVMIERNSMTQAPASHFRFSEYSVVGAELHWRK